MGFRHSTIAWTCAAAALGAVGFAAGSYAETPRFDRAPIRDTTPDAALLTFSGARAAASIDPGAIVRWDAVDLDFLRAEDAELERTGERRIRVAVNRETPQGDLRAPIDGELVVTPAGDVVWRIALEAAGARAIRTHFSSFDLPQGGRVVMRGADGGRTFVYDGDGPIGTGEFWSEPIFDDTVFIEYQSDDGFATTPTITINAISHFYRLSGHDDLEGDGAERGTSLCSLTDPNCHLELSDPAQLTARDAVGRYTFVEGGFGFLCSGCLINDNDPNTYAGYFYSAAHCVDNQTVASTMTIYWHYGTSFCGSTIPDVNSVPTSSGALLLGQSGNSDYSFFRLNEDPSAGQGFAPMSFDAPSSGETVHMIHHPAGSWKRYSRGTYTGDEPHCGPSSQIYTWDWDLGTIQGGSSGSPLFNEDFEVIGALTGTCWFCLDEACTQPTCSTDQSHWVNFGPRTTSGGTLIQSYLNSMAAEDNFEDNDTIVDSTVLPIGDHNLHLVDFDDYYTVELCEPGVITALMSYDTSDMDADLSLRNSSGAALRFDALSGGNGSVSGSFDAGIYHIHVERKSGWGGPYSLSLSAGEDENENGISDACEAPACPGDVNGSGAVDALDLAIVVGNWGPCPNPPCSWDITQDGQITAIDIAELLSYWGPCP